MRLVGGGCSEVCGPGSQARRGTWRLSRRRPRMRRSAYGSRRLDLKGASCVSMNLRLMVANLSYLTFSWSPRYGVPVCSGQR